MNPLAIVVLLIVGWEGDHFHNIGIYLMYRSGIAFFTRAYFVVRGISEICLI